MPWPTTSRRSRGYGPEWDRLRKEILERDSYLCQCRHCKAEGRTSLATEVDHVVSKSKARALGWTDAQIDAPSNLQSINGDCHKRKTDEDEGRTKRQPVGLDGWPTDNPGGEGSNGR
jgi:5-methylcytosine-specific restriction protein A